MPYSGSKFGSDNLWIKKKTRGKLRKLCHILAQLEFFIFLAGKSSSQMNYSVSKHMLAACRARWTAGHSKVYFYQKRVFIRTVFFWISAGCVSVLRCAPICFSTISQNVATSLWKKIHEWESFFIFLKFNTFQWTFATVVCMSVHFEFTMYWSVTLSRSCCLLIANIGQRRGRSLYLNLCKLIYPCVVLYQSLWVEKELPS